MLSNMCYQILTQTKWSNLDLLILDLPPGTDIQLTLIQRLSLDGIIIITTPNELAYMDVIKGIDFFNKTKTPLIGLIENMSYYQCNSY